MNFEIDIERFLDELYKKTETIDEKFNSEFRNFTSYEKFDFVFKSLTGEKSSAILFTANEIEQRVSNMILFIKDLKDYFEKNLNDNQFAKYNNKYYVKDYVKGILNALENSLKRIYNLTYKCQFENTTYYLDRKQSFTFTNKNDNVVHDSQENNDISQSPQNLNPIAPDDESNTIQTEFTPDEQPTIQNDDVSEVVHLTPHLPFTFEIDIENFLDELYKKVRSFDKESNSEYSNLGVYEKFDFVFKSLTGREHNGLFDLGDEKGLSNVILFIKELKEYFEKNLNDNQFEKYGDYRKGNVTHTLRHLELDLIKIYEDTYKTEFTPDEQPTIQNDDVSEVVPLTSDLPLTLNLSLTPNSEIEALDKIIERLNKIKSKNTIYKESNIFNYCCQKIFGKNSNEIPNLKKEDLIKEIDSILDKIEGKIRLNPEQKYKLREKLEAMKDKLNGKAMPKKNSSSFDKQKNHIGRPENKPQKENNDKQPKRSQRVNKFKIGNIDYKAYLSALKKYGPYALGGTAIGLAVSAITPGLIWSGFGTVRIVYSTAKFANKIWAKLSGGPTPIDKIVTKGLEYFKYKMNKSDFGFDMVRRIEKANIFLKKPKVQWLMTGFAVGYKLGEFFELNDKIKNIFNNSQSSSVTVPKDKMNFQTTEPEPTMPSTESNINETIPQQSTGINQSTPSRKPNFTENMSNVSMDSGTVKPPTPIEPVGSSNDYSWLDIGKEGDKIDLTAMTEGYTDSYAATGAYEGPYEHLNKAVHLATKYATEANGTFISEIRLPNGDIFTGGNVGELLDYLEKNGIDPSQCAANVCNSNGYYTWGNLEKALEALSKGTGRGR